ncbi:MAG TPA: tRNA preQ1(34) S-adenosylmethionine ribosyltransferase-isomerase QueA [Kofleriaceae bacterium]|nr:tRNA preQ1(34) S-adenosylmethionine ribosyltransferase-isomerase QueA [Kofleriaceae bacterium]
MWRVADYHYDLPPERIAQHPTDRRDASRLLAVAAPNTSAAAPDLADRADLGDLADLRFTDLAELVPDGAVLVVNDARVIPARLRARKPTGGNVELLLLEPADPDRPDAAWVALARSHKPLRAGAELALLDRDDQPAALARIASPRRPDGTVLVELADLDPRAGAPPPTPLAILERLGDVPLPPYIERAAGAEPADRDRYQTVYAARPGAVAAPTAGLHFTPELLAALDARGITRAPLTLHVGLGTFAPVRGDDLRAHRLHRERYVIPDETARLVGSGRPVVAIGTTSVRALEAAALGPREVRPGPGSTDLFIGPGFRFQIVDHLVTNFHLPGSTLLVLVCAFAGHARVMAAYRHAVAAGYRFYSYGDAMLLARQPSP